jgi:acetyltransferase-like isoleucine patch superfamily enzyme
MIEMEYKEVKSPIKRIYYLILYISSKIRGSFYKPFFKKVGKNFRMSGGCKLNECKNISIGDNITLGSCIINGAGGLVIEDNVLFAPNVSIFAVTHNYEDVNKDIMFQGSSTKSIKIGKGSWIGANCVILSGVNIGKHCVIGAGAIVTKDVPDFYVAGGVPARIIKKIK